MSRYNAALALPPQDRDEAPEPMGGVVPELASPMAQEPAHLSSPAAPLTPDRLRGLLLLDPPTETKLREVYAQWLDVGRALAQAIETFNERKTAAAEKNFPVLHSSAIRLDSLVDKAKSLTGGYLKALERTS